MNWAVIRINDDGRRQIVNRNMCALAAEKVAGALRDASTEEQIAAGWNYLTKILKQDRFANRQSGPMNTPTHQATAASLSPRREAVKDQPRRGLGRSGELWRAPTKSTASRR